MWEYYSSISSTTIFSVLINQIWYIPDAIITWLCSGATYNIEAIYNIVQQECKSHSTYQPAKLSRSALGLKSKDRWVESAVKHYFSSNNVRLLASSYLQKRDESNRV